MSNCERTMMNQSLSRCEAAKHLNIAEVTLATYVSERKIAASGRGRKQIFKLADLEAYRATRPQMVQDDEEPVFAVFDFKRFFADVDQVRKARRRSWNHVSHVAGVCCTTQTRQKDNLMINTVVPLAIWAGLSLDKYVCKEQSGE